LVKDVARIINKMPLWKLQTIGSESVDFPYENCAGTVDHVELRPGVAFCLRRFHGLIEDLVRGAWVRFVRGLRKNRSVLGEVAELDEFLFGSERADLSAFRPILFEVQNGSCFYCTGRLKGEPAVDHFIPWARYPVDLGHNFVLTHAKCNKAKGDRLGAFEHLESWCNRNEKDGAALDAEFSARGLIADRTASERITRWAYGQVEAAGGRVWIAGDDLVPLDERWRSLAGLGGAAA
jgi:hypothetical protein